MRRIFGVIYKRMPYEDYSAVWWCLALFGFAIGLLAIPSSSLGKGALLALITRPTDRALQGTTAIDGKTALLSLPPIVATLAQGAGYLKISVSLRYNIKKVNQIVEKRSGDWESHGSAVGKLQTSLQDSVIQGLGSLTIEDVGDDEGYSLMKETIVDSANEQLGDGDAVTEAYFDSLVVVY